MATLTLTLGESADDAAINENAYNDSQTAMQVGGVSDAPLTNFGQGWRFTNVTLTEGQGAVELSATETFTFGDVATLAGVLSFSDAFTLAEAFGIGVQAQATDAFALAEVGVRDVFGAVINVADSFSLLDAAAVTVVHYRSPLGANVTVRDQTARVVTRNTNVTVRGSGKTDVEKP